VVSLYSFEGKVFVFLCRIRAEVFLVPETVHVIRSVSVLIASPAELSMCDTANFFFFSQPSLVRVDRLVTEHLRAQSIKVRW
jgi:hypothetical protein